MGQALSYHVVCVLHNTFVRRNLLQHQQWNYWHSHLTATSAILLPYQVLYIIPFLSRQEQDTAKVCPFPIFRTWLHHRICWRSCSTAQTFAVLRIEEWRSRQWLARCVQSVLWRVQLRTINRSHDLAFWTLFYYWLHVVVSQLRTSVQCAGCGLWSGYRRSCSLEGSLFLRRNLNLDFRHLAFLRRLLTAQTCWSISLECTQQNGVILCKQNPIVGKTSAEEKKCSIL